MVFRRGKMTSKDKNSENRMKQIKRLLKEYKEWSENVQNT